jgi:hypothetical protein
LKKSDTTETPKKNVPLNKEQEYIEKELIQNSNLFLSILIFEDLREDIYKRVKKVLNEGDYKVYVDEVKNKLFHFKDFNRLRQKMSEFYQNKLCKS